jgi:hypothetical protein
MDEELPHPHSIVHVDIKLDAAVSASSMRRRATIVSFVRGLQQMLTEAVRRGYVQVGDTVSMNSIVAVPYEIDDSVNVFHPPPIIPCLCDSKRIPQYLLNFWEKLQNNCEDTAMWEDVIARFLESREETETAALAPSASLSGVPHHGWVVERRARRPHELYAFRLVSTHGFSSECSNLRGTKKHVHLCLSSRGGCCCFLRFWPDFVVN